MNDDKTNGKEREPVDGPVKVIDRRWWTHGETGAPVEPPRKPTYLEELERQIAEKDQAIQEGPPSSRALDPNSPEAPEAGSSQVEPDFEPSAAKTPGWRTPPGRSPASRAASANRASAVVLPAPRSPESSTILMATIMDRERAGTEGPPRGPGRFLPLARSSFRP